MNEVESNISEVLGVRPIIEPGPEIIRRVDFLKRYLLFAKKKGFVLGISGGQDSCLAGRLAQLAVEQLTRETGRSYQFIAMRLPYGRQQDADDADTAMRFIAPSRSVTVDIKAAVDATVASIRQGEGSELTDYVRGNVKARERMNVQYAVAGFYDLLVVGTDHAAEAVTGFFTKFGDGGADIVPLAGLTKGQGRKMLIELGAPSRIYLKQPTADLLDEQPGRPDEDELNIAYEAIDAFLTGGELPKETKTAIAMRYQMTEHKRRGPVTPFDTWWQSQSH
jgi:NAD+ synthase